jgi:type IX secretion system substrate protein
LFIVSTFEKKLNPLKHIMKKSLLILASAGTLTIQAQCCFNTTYPSSTGWKMDGGAYTIGTSSFNFVNTPCNSSGSTAFSYATHPLACTLSDSAWIGDVDFEYTGRGSGGISHSLLAVIADTMNAWNTSSLGSTNQNAIEAYVASKINGAQNTDSLYAHSKVGTTWNAVSKGIALPSMGVTYYIRLQRISSTLGKINLFTDPARTIQAPGSPQTFVITSAVTGLSYVQHGAIPQGFYTRTLTGTLKNLDICDSIATAPTTGINKLSSVSNTINIYPNPSNGSFIIETNATTKQTIQMYDVNGKLVLSQIINDKTNIDAGSLNEGIYNISIISNEGVVNKRLIIVR